MSRHHLLAAASLALACSSAIAGDFRIWSDDITGGRLGKTQEFNAHGCSGGNLSPQLAWADAPAGTRSFVVTVYDPDAPTGSGFWHWVVANLPADSRSLASGAGSGKASLPAGSLETRTDMGSPGFVGACPPAGERHRYQFTVHALKVDHLDITQDTSAALVGFMTHMNSLGQATFTATYAR